ncbi:hypothetical protein NM208_g1698 [Fusarium decemcellulare]|uniref:Uncharacterized protein n=1 Tax=Fusarium decemcellulare TaxID=57161 RepID=A0ACC1SVT2_9HYPO|nr:hypothetical protein NM208_g1698 [Fusarium decemcellulare]
MEVTFGAVGDFISIGVLIKDFIDLLDDSRGSAWEYKSLKQQLTFLRQNLDLAKRSYDEYYNAPEFRDIRDTLESVVDEAERRLEQIAIKVQKYTSTLSQGSTQRTIKRVARKVQWSLEKKETEKFLLDLNRYTSIIQSLQFDAFARLMQRNFDSSQKDQSDTQELMRKLQNDFGDRLASLEDELRAVRTTSSNTQQYLLTMGAVVTMRLDTMAQAVNSLGIVVLRGASGICSLGTSILTLLSTMHNSIMGRLERPPHMGPFFTFEDYLGVDSIILLNFVDSWNAFEGSLYGKFKGRKGGRRVAQNRFLLQDHQTGEEIHRDVHWSLAIVPGSRIDMSLICEVKEDEEEAQSLKCPFPSCGAMCEGVIGTVIKCDSCQQLFRKLPGMSDDEEVPEAPDAPDPRTNDASQASERGLSGTVASHKIKRGLDGKTIARRPRRKLKDSDGAESDSDDTDLAGIKRVTVLPILLHPIRPAPEDLKVDRKFGPSAQQLALDEQAKRAGPLKYNNTSDNIGTASYFVETLKFGTESYFIKPRPRGKNGRLSKSDEAHLRSGTTYVDGKAYFTYQQDSAYEDYPDDKSSYRGAYEFKKTRPDTRRTTKQKQPSTRKATDADARKHNIPIGYSLRNWDPEMEPILLLGSVFDANSLGKWIYDWTVYAHGSATPIADMAGELWLLLIQLSGKVKRSEEVVEKVRSKESRDTVEEFIEAGERLFVKLKRLIKNCERPMLESATKKKRKEKNDSISEGNADGLKEKGTEVSLGAEKDEPQSSSGEPKETATANVRGERTDAKKTNQRLGKSAGVAFVETLFGRDNELGRTERFMQNCNGRRPKCDACDRLGFECLYEQQEGSANVLVPRDLFTALETRVKLLEFKLEQQNERLTTVEGDARRSTRQVRQDSLEVRPQSSDVVVNVEGIRDSSIEQSMTDGMAVSFVGEQDCGFFGPSSNIAFMRHILRAMDKRRPSGRRLSSHASGSEFSPYEGGIVNSSNTLPPSSPSPTRNSFHNINANILPPDSEVQRLIRAYFSNTGLLYPYIYEKDFLDTYERLRAGAFRSNVRRTWLGLLNMILAMATCTSCWENSGSDYRFEQSDMYYRRARELCPAQIFRGTTLETVQYLLLVSQYLQGTQKSVHTWMTHGLAVKAAMSIGLHSGKIASKFTPLEQEIRKRTWSLSMTFGRPCAIPEEYIRLDLPTALPSSNSIPEMQQLSTDFFNASMIVTTLYGSNLGCDEQPSETTMAMSIIQFGQELTEWRNNLPLELSIRNSDDIPHEGEIQDSTKERFCLILSLRYFNVQLLLHRPTFIGSLLKPSKLSHRRQIPVNHVQANFGKTFVQTAENIIDIIHTVLTRPDLGRRFIGAWWFTLYYAFSAALAIFGSLIASQDDGSDDAYNIDRAERAKRFLAKASEALSRMGAQNTVISRCINFLQQLLRAVNNWNPACPQTLEQSTATETITGSDSGSFDLASDLLSTIPTFDSSAVALGDELELGHFFATDFERWLERNHW